MVSVPPTTVGLQVRESADEPRPRLLRELDRVALRDPVSDDGVTLPAGASGTIVAVWAPGEAYEVEFTQPAEAVVTLRRHQLRALPRR